MHGCQYRHVLLGLEPRSLQIYVDGHDGSSIKTMQGFECPDSRCPEVSSYKMEY